MKSCGLKIKPRIFIETQRNNYKNNTKESSVVRV